MKLSEITGPIADIKGYVSHEFGSDVPVFKISCVVLADGTELYAEGEHDMPYLCEESVGCMSGLNKWRLVK